VISPDKPELMLNDQTYIMILTEEGKKMHSFKHFSNPAEVIRYMASMSQGATRVKQILRMDVSGRTWEMNVVFSEGKLVLSEMVQPIDELKIKDASTIQLVNELASRRDIEDYKLVDWSDTVDIPVGDSEQKIIGPCRILVYHI
jgi:hypothetical protein